MVYKFGIIGSGRFIGDMHIKGAQFDHRAKLICGCFSRDSEKNARLARKYSAKRSYTDIHEMAKAEQALGELDFVTVVTPNANHFEICKVFLEAGFNVVCDKPVTINSQQALKLKSLAQKNSRLFCVSYTYFGYPMLAQARALIHDGAIGGIMTVNASYLQDGRLNELLDGSIYANSWKQNPVICGPASTLFDIGVHVDYAIRYVTGLNNKSVLSVLDFKPNDPPLETSASILVRYNNGALGTYIISQVAAGATNDMHIEIFGTKGSLLWDSSNTNQLVLRKYGEPVRTYLCSRPYNDASVNDFVRMPYGIYEGAYEAFANIYTHFYDALDGAENPLYPDINDGLCGVLFVEACICSFRYGSTWTDVPI